MSSTLDGSSVLQPSPLSAQSAARAAGQLHHESSTSALRSVGHGRPPAAKLPPISADYVMRFGPVASPSLTSQTGPLSPLLSPMSSITSYTSSMPARGTGSSLGGPSLDRLSQRFDASQTSSGKQRSAGGCSSGKDHHHHHDHERQYPLTVAGEFVYPWQRHVPTETKAILEEYRRSQNIRMLSMMNLEGGQEHRREYRYNLAGSTAEKRRLLKIHAIQREDARRRILRKAIEDEIGTVQKLKQLGVTTFAQFAGDDVEE